MTGDLLARLRDVAPTADQEWASSPDGQRLMALAARRGALPALPVRRGRWRTASALLLAAGVVLGTGTAVAQLAYDTPNDTRNVLCYEELDLQASGFGFTSTLDQAVGKCRDNWLRATGEPAPANLVVCVNPTRGRGVFPGPPGLTPHEVCDLIDSTPERPS